MKKTDKNKYLFKKMLSVCLREAFDCVFLISQRPLAKRKIE